MLFFVSFGGAVSPMLLDASSEEAAKEMCLRVAEKPPIKIKPIACDVFAANLFVEDEDEGEVIVIDPLDEITELLEAFDAEDEDIADDVVCGDESDYEGETVVCTLAVHDDGDHKGASSSGVEVTW